MTRTPRAVLTAVAATVALLGVPTPATAVDDPPPAPVSGFTVTGTADGTTLAWTLPDDPDLARVVVRRAAEWGSTPDDPTAGEEVASGLITTWTDSVASYQVPFVYAVFTQDAAGQWSEARTAGNTTFLPDIGGLASTVTRSSVTLTWTRPSDRGVAGVRIRRVDCLTPGTVLGASDVPRDVTTWTVGDLPRSTTVCLRLQAYDARGIGSVTVQRHVTTTSAADPVTSVVANPRSESVGLNWALPDDPEVTGVEVRRNVSASAPEGTLVYAGAGTSVVDSGLRTERSYTYQVRTRTAVGGLSPARTVTARTGLTWNTAVAAPFRGAPGTIECPRSTWCMELDRSGQWQVLSGSTWSAPRAVPDAGPEPSWLLSCPQVGWCLASGPGGFRTFSSGQWSTVSATPQPTTGTARSLTCVSPTWCVAMLSGAHVAVFTGRTWTTPGWVGSLRSGEFGDVACQAAGRCFAVGQSSSGQTGYRATLSSGQWSSATLSGGPASGIDCPTSSACVAPGWSSTWTISGTSWTRVPTTTAPRRLLSCSSPTSCLSEIQSESSRWNGRGWASPTALAPTNALVTGLSCPHGSTVCHAVDNRGHHYRWTASTGWRLQSTFDDTTGELDQPACVSTTDCIAVDHNGWLFHFGGAVWQPRSQVFTAWARVSCTTSGFCLGLQADGGSRAARSGTWGARSRVPTSSPLGAPSCVVTTCLALDADGRAWRFSGTAWTSAGRPFAASDGGSPGAVRCTSTTSCMAVAPNGRWSRWNGSTWTVKASLPSTLVGVGAPALDCTSASACVAVVDSGATAVWTASSWKDTGSTSSGAGRGVSALDCVRPDWCLGVRPEESDRPAVWVGDTWLDASPFGTALTGAGVACPTTDACVVTGGEVAGWTGPPLSTPVPARLPGPGTIRTLPRTVR